MKQIYWEHFTRSYLETVKFLCDNYQNQFNVAIIYNMKHAIEIFLKTLIRIADNDSEENIVKHELDNLFRGLRKKIENQKITEVIERLTNQSDELALFAKQEINLFSKYITNIDTIIKYYSELSFLNKEAQIADKSNFTCRYPENTKGKMVKIDHFDLLFTHELDVEKIKEDVRTIEIYFNSIKTVLEVYHRHKGS